LENPVTDVPERLSDVPRAEARARRNRAQAKELAKRGDEIGALRMDCEAADVEAASRALRAPGRNLRRGRGGTTLDTMDVAARPGVLADVVASPDALSARADLDRLDLAGNRVTAAVDMAEQLGARDSGEKALAHQLAAAHSLAMRLAAQAEGCVGRIGMGEPFGSIGPREQVYAVEAARLAGASARMMEAFNRGILTLQRLRSDGEQRITVQHIQHVSVAEGAQAVVAGRVERGGTKRDGK